MGTSIRVVIVDDHPLIRDGLRRTIERSGAPIEIVGEAEDGAQALELLARCRVDVVLLDITMPRLNGLEVARALPRLQRRARVVMLSVHSTREHVEQALDAGARGYLTKESAGGSVVEAIRAVHAGRFYLSPDVTGFLVDRGPGAAAGVLSSLTAIERRVLELLAEGRTTKEIADAMSCSPNTVRVHRHKLMSKLDLHRQAELVRFAIREGLARL
jgi:DNA-binding NarL/FixJ family response regulator